MQFNIRYYNGLNSRSNPATLFIKKNIWHIEYHDVHKNIIHVFWHPSAIKPVELTGQNITLSYGVFPPASLECDDTELLNYLHEVKGNNSASNKLFRFVKEKGSKAVVGITAALLALVVFIYFVILPFAAEGLASFVPHAYEQKMGYYMKDNFLYDLEIDYELTDAVNEFSSEINYDLDIDPEIIVVDHQLVNAFALPGGHIVIFEGILSKMDNDNQLAALLCHEVAHVKYKHSLKSIFKNLGGYLFISWLFSDLNAVTAIIVENAHILHTLSYSRNLEHEADEKALEMLESNNISQQGMVELFQLLKNEAIVNTEDLNFLSTHPLTADRIRYSKDIAKDQSNVKSNPGLKEKFETIMEIIEEN